MRKNGIAVAGNILTDIINTVSKYPDEGELTKILSVEKSVGGCVPNVAIDLKKFAPELNVYALGRVSNDENGKYSLNYLKNHGINTENIVVANVGRTSFTQVISIDGGQRTFFTYPGSSDEFCVEDVNFNKISPKILHLGYILLLKKIDEGDGIKILKKAIEKGIRTSIDLVSENSDRYKNIIPVLKYVDYLIINETEGGRLTKEIPNKENIPDIAKKLMGLGVREKVIIHYKCGCVCCNKYGEIVKKDSISVPNGYIKGTTGAGDAFCAGCLFGIYEGLTDENILNYGNLCATVSLRKSDSTSGVVTINEAKNIIDGFKRN